MFSVASYNIHRGIGTDRRHDLERILTVIATLDVDVLALQEVETPAEPDPSRTALELLPRLAALDYTPLFAPTLRSGGTDYGNLLLSRWPITACQHSDLSVPGREPRSLITAEIEHLGRPLRVMATHLGLGLRERRAQVAKLAARIDVWQMRAQPSALVVLGDFNHPCTNSPGLRALRARLASVPARASYPARWPLLPLDRLFYSGLHLTRWGVLHSPIAQRASDHRPVWACFA